MWFMIMFLILTKDDCPWCDRAKALLEEREAPYGAFHYKDHPMLVPLMKKAGLKTVPQIWVDTPDGKHYIGGYEDLVDWLKAQSIWNMT